MKKRKRVKTNVLASSYNYEGSKRFHRNELLRNHLENLERFLEIEALITNFNPNEGKTPYVRVWGKLVEIEKTMVTTIEKTMTIIWK